MQVTHYCRRLFGIEEEINYGGLSPLVPYALYQSAAIQRQLQMRTGDSVYEENVAFLKKVLWSFSKRWRIACMSTILPPVAEMVSMLTVVIRDVFTRIRGGLSTVIIISNIE